MGLVTISIGLFRAPAKVIALAAGALFFANFSAKAADDYYVFKSLLSTPNAGWCINVAQDQAAAHVMISACSGKPSQAFGYEGGGTLTNGGYCLDAQPGAPNQPPGAGDPVVIAECTGADSQIWDLQPFKRRADAFAISNQDGLCVTVDGNTIGEGAPLVLAQCAEQDNQGWLRSTAAAASVGPEAYFYSGHRYCWYDGGWHGSGWYWCGDNFHQGIGWGGPIGWHWWHHHGQPFHPHPHPHPHPLPHPILHPHGVIHPHVFHPHAVIHPHGVGHPHGGVHPHATVHFHAAVQAHAAPHGGSHGGHGRH